MLFVCVSIVNMFLDKRERFLSENAVLVTITPLAVSGVEIQKDQFKSIVPHGYVLTTSCYFRDPSHHALLSTLSFMYVYMHDINTHMHL